MSDRPTNAQVLSELARVKALFQLRAIETVIRGELPRSMNAQINGLRQEGDNL